MSPPVQTGLREEARLFRQEAIDFYSSARQLGEPSPEQPLSSKVLVWLLVAAVLCATVFLFVAQYARKETVVGYLTPTAGRAKVFALQPGTIRVVHVAEGQKVEKGQPLITVETSQLSGDGTDVNSTLLATLVPQKELISQQIAGEERRTTSERTRLTDQVAGLETQIKHLQARISTQEQQVALKRSVVEAAEHLEAKQLIATVELRRRRAELLDQIQNQDALRQQLAALGGQLLETRTTLQQFPVIMEQKIQGIRNELSNVAQRTTEVEGRRAYVIRAPTAGRVSALQSTVGQTIDPHQLQMEIIPVNSVLQAEMFVPTRAIGFVKPGQEVRIMYEAFPYQNFGTYQGRIAKVSQTILTPSDVAGPIALKEPAYRITVKLERPDISAYGKTIPLQADMMLRADVILEKRTLMQWFLHPLLSVRS